ncbi:hypothetical protein [Sorangium sp. So ce128]|uniref:hypothetical protein n=1 Tax=Sorangium sp. So ce128 TaxID=3133281 RepID=UPI003F601A9A
MVTQYFPPWPAQRGPTPMYEPGRPRFSSEFSTAPERLGSVAAKPSRLPPSAPLSDWKKMKVFSYSPTRLRYWINLPMLASRFSTMAA